MMLAAVALGASLASGHGVLTKPVSRALYVATNDTNGIQFAGSCPNKACVWYSQKVAIPGEVTNCDPKMRTMGVSCGDKNPSDFTCEQRVPWCAPGSAPVRSPCGVFAGGWNMRGRDMLDLPGQPREVWPAGSTQEVGWAITANHGGGYAFRLCRADSDLSEECFQANHLEFVGDTQSILNTTGGVVAEIPAFRLSTGTWPKGSQWTRNPFPMEKGLPGIPGLPDVYGRGPFAYNVIDRVKIPDDLAAGDYVLSWRWEAEQTQQVWSHCSDVSVTVSSGADRRSEVVVPPTQHKPRESPHQIPKGYNARYVCTGDSLGLDVVDCDTWVDLYDALGGDKWPREWASGCSDLRLDPCGCNSDWQKYVQCNPVRDYLRITEMYMLSPALSGSLPDSIGNFSALIALSLVNTNIQGSLPESIGRLANLEMLWLDHNPRLGGPLPQSLANLTKFTAIELHHSNFSGALPLLDWGSIPDCTLNDNVFDCPLAPGAEKCGAKCA